MEMSLSLATQIGAMLIMVAVGYALIRLNVCSLREIRILSLIVLYAGAPCAIVNAFQIELTADKLKGFALSIVAAVVIHIIFIVLGEICGRLLGFNVVEKLSIMYPNSGNLIIPLVGRVLGQEMVFYCSGYMIVQTIMLWTHCKFAISEEREFDIRKIILNINILAIIVGMFLFITQTKMPTMIASSMTMMANTMAPLSMFVIGMLLADMDLLEGLRHVRIYVVCLFRLIVYPLIVLAVIYVSGITHLFTGANQILMVTMLAASAPVASTIAQFAQLYNKHEFEASIINGLSILMCIITMPLINMLYMFLF